MQPNSRIAEALTAFNGGDLAKAREIVEREVGKQPSSQLQHFLGIIHCRQGQPATGVDWLLARRRGPIFNPSASQVIELLSDRAAGRWRRYEAQLEPVLPILLPWAKRLGYAT